MVLLETGGIPMGTPCPDFDLPSVDGGRYRLADFSDNQVLVVMFICNHCPYVQAIEDRYVALAAHFAGRSVQLVGICANDPVDYPDDAPENLARRAAEKGYGFPYLFDGTQEVARAFGAVCTPDLYVYDAERKLAYHGRLDNSWNDPDGVTREDLKGAVEALLAGDRPAADQVPAMGCSIKWRRA